MSMIYRVFAIPDEVAGETLADPERVHGLVHPWDRSPNILSLEESWHGLHFLMTGDVWAIWSEPRADLVNEYTGFLQGLKAFIKTTADSHQSLLLVVQ